MRIATYRTTYSLPGRVCTTPVFPHHGITVLFYLYAFWSAVPRYYGIYQAYYSIKINYFLFIYRPDPLYLMNMAEYFPLHI